jgi:ABC-2 type transport system permease protein
MSVTETTIKSNHNKPGGKIFAVILLLIAANIAAWFFYTQADLTRDSRYTITDATKRMLKHLDNKVEVLVFLTGDDLPAPFQRLSNSTESLLRNFRDISGNKVTYKVIDPVGSDTSALHILNQYHMSGIPVTISAGKKGSAQKMIFPWALVTMVDAQGKSVAYPVFLQEVNTFNLNRQTLLKSEILLEYNIAGGIHQLTRKDMPAVAYLTGNGELFDGHIAAMFSALSRRYYRLDTFNLGMNNIIPAAIKTVIINRPVTAFSETDKFKIDQYVMNGGNVLWSINMVSGTLDSMFNPTGHFNSMPIELNLNDLLFNYGVRINPNVVEDAVNHAFIPLQAKSAKARSTMFDWIYFPVLNAGSDHPIVKNLNGVLTRFVSSIDTNSNDPAIKKTVLLSSSRYSKIEAAPLPIIVESAIEPPNVALFPKRNLIGAILLEGNFSSGYATRKPVEVADMIASLKIQAKTKTTAPGKMIVTGDADMLSNEFAESVGPSEMGMFAPDQSIKFDNESFLVNCMEYMNDPDNLLEARAKSFDNSILDPKVVEQERTKWQFINIGVPVISILIFGAVFFFVRKRKYA